MIKNLMRKLKFIKVLPIFILCSMANMPSTVFAGPADVFAGNGGHGGCS